MYGVCSPYVRIHTYFLPTRFTWSEGAELSCGQRLYFVSVCLSRPNKTPCIIVTCGDYMICSKLFLLFVGYGLSVWWCTYCAYLGEGGCAQRHAVGNENGRGSSSYYVPSHTSEVNYGVNCHTLWSLSYRFFVPWMRSVRVRGFYAVHRICIHIHCT